MIKIKIWARDIDDCIADNDKNDRYIDMCVCDNINRALDMYRDECDDQEDLVYQVIE